MQVCGEKRVGVLRLHFDGGTGIFSVSAFYRVSFFIHTEQGWEIPWTYDVYVISAHKSSETDDDYPVDHDCRFCMV